MDHLKRVLEKTNVRRYDIVVMTVRPFNAGAGEYELRDDQLFSDYEQELFTKVVTIAEKQGKTVELLVVPAVDPFDPDFRPWGDEYPPGLLALRLIAALPADYRRELAVVRAALDVGVLLARIDTIAEVLRTAGRRDEVLAYELDQLEAHLDEPRAFVAERRAYLDGLELP